MDLPATTPAMILPGATLFPGTMLPLRIFEPRYRKMLRDVLAGDRTFAVVMRQPGATNDAPVEIGALGLVRASVENSDGTSNLFLLGVTRFLVRDVLSERDYPVLRIAPAPETESVKAAALALKLRELVHDRAQHLTSQPTGTWHQIAEHLDTLEAPSRLADFIAHTLVHEAEHRQTLLATLPIADRLDKLIAFLMEQP